MDYRIFVVQFLFPIWLSMYTVFVHHRHILNFCWGIQRLFSWELYKRHFESAQQKILPGGVKFENSKFSNLDRMKLEWNYFWIKYFLIHIWRHMELNMNIALFTEKDRYLEKCIFIPWMYSVWCEVIIIEQFHKEFFPVSCMVFKIYWIDLIRVIVFHLKGLHQCLESLKVTKITITIIIV